MKTTFYIPFAIVNTLTHNFLLGVVATDDEEFINKIKRENLYASTNPTLRDYIFDHPESFNHVASFVETIKYFHKDCFEARFLGSFIEKKQAQERIQLALDSFSRSDGKRLYYNECYNLNDSIENETEEQNKIKNLSSHMKEASDKYARETNRVNNKSEVKKQSITIVENETGEEHNFETKGDCMRWLKCATDTFARFLKGQTKLNKKYRVKEELLTESSLT